MTAFFNFYFSANVFKENLHKYYDLNHEGWETGPNDPNNQIQTKLDSIGNALKSLQNR